MAQTTATKNHKQPPMTNIEKQAARYAALKRIALAAGWSSMAAYHTALINGVIQLPRHKKPARKSNHPIIAV